MDQPTDHEGDERLQRLFSEESPRFVNAETLAVTALRKAILTSALPPGRAIDEEKMGRMLSLSRSPIRQALGILESEGLVRRIYRKKVVVTELTEAQIEEIYNMRALLEGLAVRRAVPLCTAEHLRKIEDALTQFPVPVEGSGDAYRFVEWNSHFHILLYEPSGWHQLIGLIRQLRNNTARYIGASHHLVTRLTNSRVRHEVIVDAYRQGDAEQAESLLKAHVLSAMELLLTSMRPRH